MNTSTTAITATPAAVTYIKKFLEKQGTPKVQAVRLNIVKAGCSGYRYELTAVDEAHPALESDKIFSLNDQLSLHIDRKFFPYVMGTVIDYQKMGLGEQLVYQNPNQTGTCGCGESFTVSKDNNE